MDEKSDFQHCGVVYAVQPVAPRRWRWTVQPPKCVLGMQEEVGEIEGDRGDAIRAAHAAINWQVVRATVTPPTQ